MKQRHPVVLLLVVLSAGGVALRAQNGPAGSGKAVDPIVGTWKLNIARSKVDPATLTTAPLRENETEVYREIADGQMQMVWTRPDANGSLLTSTFIWPVQGGTVQDEFTTAMFSSIVTVIRPGDFYVTYLQNGKQAYIMHKVVGRDGKTMTLTQAGVDPSGRRFERVLIWERQ